MGENKLFLETPGKWHPITGVQYIFSFSLGRIFQRNQALGQGVSFNVCFVTKSFRTGSCVIIIWAAFALLFGLQFIYFVCLIFIYFFFLVVLALSSCVFHFLSFLFAQMKWGILVTSNQIRWKLTYYGHVKW